MLRAGDLEGIPPEESGQRGWRIPDAVVEERRRNAPRKEQASGAAGDPHAAELIEVLREQVEDLRARLDREQEANRENRRLLAAALERIPELEAPRSHVEHLEDEEASREEADMEPRTDEQRQQWHERKYGAPRQSDTSTSPTRTLTGPATSPETEASQPERTFWLRLIGR